MAFSLTVPIGLQKSQSFVRAQTAHQPRSWPYFDEVWIYGKSSSHFGLTLAYSCRDPIIPSRLPAPLAPIQSATRPGSLHVAMPM